MCWSRGKGAEGRSGNYSSDVTLGTGNYVDRFDICPPYSQRRRHSQLSHQLPGGPANSINSRCEPMMSYD
jgi:hypothetical protein